MSCFSYYTIVAQDAKMLTAKAVWPTRGMWTTFSATTCTVCMKLIDTLLKWMHMFTVSYDKSTISLVVHNYSLPGDKQMMHYLPDPFSMFS